MPNTGSTGVLYDYASLEQLQEHDQNSSKATAIGKDRKFANLNVDYSKFSNHCWYNSAYSKTYNAINRAQSVDHDATYEELSDWYYSSGTNFDRHIYDIYPKQVQYLSFEEQIYVTGSDPMGMLVPGSGSWSLEYWIKPNEGSLTETQSLFSIVGTTDVVGTIYHHVDQESRLYFDSGSTVSLQAVPTPTGSWTYVSWCYDRTNSKLYGYTGSATQRPVKVLDTAFSFGDINCSGSDGAFYIGKSLLGTSPFSGCIDELRVWRVCLSASFVNDYYNMNIYPDHNELVLYYKFNDGATGTASIDSQVRDFSGNKINSYIHSYSASCLVSGTALQREEGTIIHNAQHERAYQFYDHWIESASIYDSFNDQLITRQFPEHVIDDDENSEFVKYAYIMAEVLDEIDLYIRHYAYLDTVNYEGHNSCPDELLPLYASQQGFDLRTVFDRGSTLQQYFGENITQTGSIFNNVASAKKEIWRRVANNITYYQKTAGTKKSLQGLMSTLGLDERHIKVKQYSFLPGEKIDDNRIYTHKTKKWLFMDNEYNRVTISQPHTVGTNDLTLGLSFMMHTTASYTTASLMSMCTGSIKYAQEEYARVEIRKSTGNSGSIFAVINDDGGGLFEFSSSQLPLYYDDRYHIELVREKNPVLSKTSWTLYYSMYDIDRLRYCDSSSVTVPSASANLLAPTFYVGCPSGSTVSAKGWFSEFHYYNHAANYSEFQNRSYDLSSVGTYDPLTRSASMRIPMEYDNTYEVVGPDKFQKVQDVIGHTLYTSSMGNETQSRFQKKDTYYKFLSQDLLWSEDLVRIRNKTDLKKSEQAIDYGIESIEINPVDAINEDISRIFSSNRLYNEIYGKPIYKLRESYDLDKYRNVYFNKYSDRVKLEVFFDAYKWLDDNVTKMAEQLVSARKKFYGAQYAVEPHALEINKGTYRYSIFKTPYDMGYGDYSAEETPVSTQEKYASNHIDISPVNSQDVLADSKTMIEKFGNGSLKTVQQTYDSAPCQYYREDNINYRTSAVIHSGTDAVGIELRKDADLELMNMKYYYDLTAFVSGNHLNCFKNVTRNLDEYYTKVVGVNLEQRGWKAKTLRVTAEISSSIHNKNLDSFRVVPCWDGTLTRRIIPKGTCTFPTDYSAKCDFVFQPENDFVSSSYSSQTPAFDISGTILLKAFYIDPGGEISTSDVVNIKSIAFQMDVYTTASIKNSDLNRNHVAGTAIDASSGTYSYYDVDNKDRRIYPEEGWATNIKGIDFNSIPPERFKDYRNVLGGIHYSNAFGMIHDALYRGTKTNGNIGITDQDIIQSRFAGSEVVAVWPDQTRLKDHNKALFINGIFGDRCEDYGVNDGLITGPEIFLEENYNFLELWCYNNFYEPKTTGSAGEYLTFSIAVYESTFNDGPLASAPMLSGTISSDTTQLIEMRDNIYQFKLGANWSSGWRSKRIRIPITNPKRVRVDVRCTNNTAAGLAPEDEKLQNLAVFGRFSNENLQYNKNFFNNG